MVWRVAGFVVLIIWVAAMVLSLTIFSLGFPIPEILISPEFMMSGLGFSHLYHYGPIKGQRKTKDKNELIPSILGLGVGICILSLGTFQIFFMTPNFFTYLCLIIGIAVIFLNAKQMRARFEVDG